MKKKILIALGVVVLLAVVGVVLVFTNLDSIVRKATEKVMSYVLMVDVTVGGAKVGISEGSVEFTDIIIPNPPGYKSSRAMKFGLVKAQVDIKSFSGNEPTIKLIRLSQAEITMEAKKGGSNLQDLIDNASRLAAGEEPPPEAPKKEEPKEAEKKFKIDKVIVDGNVVRVAIPFLGGKTLDVPLPDMELNDLGGEGKGGVTPAEGMQEFLGGILASIKKAGTDILPADVLNGIGDTLKNLPGDVKEQLGAVTEQLGEAGKEIEGGLKSVGEEAGKATESIKGLFGGKKEEKK